MQELTDGGVAVLLNHLSLATEAAPKWAKAWHNWALYNVNAMEHYAQRNVEQAQRHVAPAVLGFFRSVALAQAQGSSIVAGSDEQTGSLHAAVLERVSALWLCPRVSTGRDPGSVVGQLESWMCVSGHARSCWCPVAVQRDWSRS